MQNTLHGNPYFLFPDLLKRWYFWKNRAGIWSFLYYRGRWYFFFPKIWSYNQTENERWLSQKKKKEIHGNIFSSNVLKRWSFQKGPRRDMIFLVLSGKVVFFHRKNDIFFPDGKQEREGDDLPQEIHGNMVFSIWYAPCPPCQKRSKMILSRKNTPKGDWHSWLTPHKEPQQFSVLSWRPLHRRFHISPSSEKKPGSLIYGIEVWLLLQFIRL